MKNYPYQNTLIGKKQLRQLLAWSFTNYDSIQASVLADELKELGFKYASQAGISINIEDLKIPFLKNGMMERANQEILHAEKLYFKGKMTDVERFQTMIETWSLASDSLKQQVIYYFKNYDPLNSVYIMAFSGARGNLSQVRQLVGMRGLMSDPSGQIMNLPIQKNFREGLSITDYLMSGYGARKGIVDTALKTANSGYLTRRLIDVAQDILIREKDCFTSHSFLLKASQNDWKKFTLISEKLLGRVLNQSIVDPITHELLIKANTPITPKMIQKCREKKIEVFLIRSPLTCQLYRAICQKCYGWDLSNENLVDMGEAIGILAGQSIGEPGTQLTMRTFHTGGVFTSKERQQIMSPVTGIIKISKKFKSVPLRTNQGEEVLMTKNSGILLILPEDKKQSIHQLSIGKNTLLFPKNNQYITKNSLIGEFLNQNRQIKSEIKPILSNTGGEIFIPKLKKKMNLLTQNKLIWILNGQFYNSPKNSFTNFHSDYKLNRHTYIFRTKIMNHYVGNLEFVNQNSKLSQGLIKVRNHKFSLFNAQLKKLHTPIQSKNYLFIFSNLKYLLKLQSKDSKAYLKVARNQPFGSLVNSSFQTLTGGTLYYDQRNRIPKNHIDPIIRYINRNLSNESTNDHSFICYRTILWLGEETYQVNSDSTTVLVEEGDFISEGFEFIPGRFSKTSGIVFMGQKNNLVQTISIQSGFVYEGKKLKNTSQKLYYPGELIFSNISVKTLSFCEPISGKNMDQLLVRPIDIYEVSYLHSNEIGNSKNRNFKFESKMIYSYLSNQTIKGKKNLKLVYQTLHFYSNQFWEKNTKIEIVTHKTKNSLDFCSIEKLSFYQFMVPKLRYKNIESCFLLQSNQFVDRYTVLGYLEAVTSHSFEIVKFKVRTKETKEILLISNEDCWMLSKDRFPKKQVNDFLVDSERENEIGRVLIVNDKFLIVQKGKPYFFPNCKNEEMQNILDYKKIPGSRISKPVQTDRAISLNHYDMTKVLVKESISLKKVFKTQIPMKTEFSKLWLKKNGKFYSLLIPQFLKKFSIRNPNQTLKCHPLLRPRKLKKGQSFKFEKTLFINEFAKNNSKNVSQLVLLRLLEHPFTKSTKSVGLYSITEDFLEKDVNSVFCKNNEFIDAGETIGFLNLEKEITGDIVQGLPRIEEILEARKKNLGIKRIPTSQKKGLLIQKTSLDPTFEFRKLGTPVKENEKINPHKLLKVYFNYYGLIKIFLCERRKKIKANRLIQNYEGSYKSFKKVQSFILNSVQSIYYSQGVFIHDKHLEVIIKQMTTKVLITNEGNTPILKNEVIDLYHINYINQIVQLEGKKSAFYVPFLMGITKAALNNPSFISAASFQETTRVLTKAAIEGRIDWLRGLKENIIIGHLIPAGTGFQTYKGSFQKSFQISTILNSKARQPN